MDLRNRLSVLCPGVGADASSSAARLRRQNGQQLDGGLPRHIVLNGTVDYHQENSLDFTREVSELIAMELPEKGTPTELLAMAYHEKGKHPSCTPEGMPAIFRTNGSKAVSGAPFADPVINADGTRPKDITTRTYKAADIQLDVVFNKKGWHYPQQRITTLWGDVQPTLDGKRAPEPLFFRANSGEVIEYILANLIPDYYEMDDFRSPPTDVVGQHIHLVSSMCSPPTARQQL